MDLFEIQGGKKLSGEIQIPGAKNATLPMLCASLLTKEKCVFKNVPEISDVAVLLDVFKKIGVKVNRDLSKKIVEIEAKNINPEKLKKCDELKKLRATILLLGPILARCGKCEIFQPGGDIIGTRSNEIHMGGFKVLGGHVLRDDEKISLEFKKNKFDNKRILFSEASVTGTENIAMFCAGVEDEVEIFFSAAEPHVCATLKMLHHMGTDIKGIGTHYLKIKGNKKLKGGIFEIPPDGILVGTYAIAGAITKGKLKINNVHHSELFSFYGALKRIGVEFEIKNNFLNILPTKKLEAIPKIQTAIFPGFPTDLQSLVGVLLTQCKGCSMIFETLFENRFTYLYELEKMGAKIEILNAHQAKIFGVTKLHGANVQSWDLRAGAAMVLAGLIADGKTIVSNVSYINRGYENFVKNLNNLGAKIKQFSA